MKRGGRQVTTLPACEGANHEEVEAHEGLACQRGIKRDPLFGPTVTRTKTLKTKRLRYAHPRCGRGARWTLFLGTRERNHRDERQESMLAAMSCQGFVAGVNP